MKLFKKIPSGVAILVAAVWLFLDILTKKGAATLTQTISLIPSFLELRPIHKNTGIAFGLPVPLAVQIVGSLIILGALIHFAAQAGVFRKKSVFLSVVFGVVMGGALGNLLDRITQGYVVDFILLRPIPIFNLADIGITIGLLVLFLMSLKKQPEPKNRRPEKKISS